MRRRSFIYVVGLAVVSIPACGGLSNERESQTVDPALGVGGSGNAISGGAGHGGAGRSGSASATGIGGTSSTTMPHQSKPPLPPRVPEKHRAQGTNCDHERPPGFAARSYDAATPCPDGGACKPPESCPSCRAACVDYQDGMGARCVWGSGECLTDADCAAQDNGRCFDNRGSRYCTYDTCYSDVMCTSGGPCACEGESGSSGNTCMPGNCQTDTDCGSGGYCSPTFGTCGNYSGVIAFYCHTAQDTCVDDADCINPDQVAGYCMYAPEVGHWACGYGQCVG